MIKEQIIDILNDVDDDITKYEGDNLIDDGIIDSFTIVSIISEIKERLDIVIPADSIKEIHFRTIDSIVEFVSSFM